MDTTLAYLTARGGLLPSGEEGRLATLTVSGGDRQVITFDDTNNQQTIWTIPCWPAVYTGNGTLIMVVQCIMESATSGVINLSAEVETIVSGTAFDLDAGTSFDTANTKLSSTVPSTAGQLFTVTITLTNDDSVTTDQYVRVRLKRLASGNTAAGNLRVLGAALIETQGLTEYASFFGDGSDCSDIISGTVSMTRAMYYSSLTIQNGGVLITNGYRLHVKNTLTIDSGGILKSDANDGANGSGITGGAGGVSLGGDFGTGGYGGAGATANTGSTTSGTTATGTAAQAAQTSGGRGGSGGGGGNGGLFGNDSGGTGVDFTNYKPVKSIFVPWYFMYAPTTTIRTITPISAGNGGGGGGGASISSGGNLSGGGGGGGGGASVMWVAARTLINNGTIKSNGGNGGNGANGVGTGYGGGGGGGGCGGYVLLVLEMPGSTVGTVQTNAGSGGNGGTGAVNGSAGNAGTGTGFVLKFDTVSQQYF